jgi:hypothetical protein
MDWLARLDEAETPAVVLTDGDGAEGPCPRPAGPWIFLSAPKPPPDIAALAAFDSSSEPPLQPFRPPSSYYPLPVAVSELYPPRPSVPSHLPSPTFPDPPQPPFPSTSAAPPLLQPSNLCTPHPLSSFSFSSSASSLPSFGQQQEVLPPPVYYSQLYSHFHADAASPSFNSASVIPVPTSSDIGWNEKGSFAGDAFEISNSFAGTADVSVWQGGPVETPERWDEAGGDCGREQSGTNIGEEGVFPFSSRW